MNRCQLREFRADVDEAELQREFDFCHSLTEENSNGFKWPTELREAKDLAEFRAGLIKLVTESELNLADLAAGKVPKRRYWVYAEDRVIGIGRISEILTPAQLERNGHVAYALGEEVRGKGYGTETLALLLDVCHDLGMNDALILVRPSNFPSRRVIEKNGGKMWDIIKREQPVTSPEAVRYWVDLRNRG